ncbi:MAG TPA: class I SAM-dependent methyltransferase [Opitutaceae bacterium]
MQTAKWPKILPPLTEEQKKISDAFMKLWHEELPSRFGVVETFNHNFPVRASHPGFKTTIEIGAGLGEHVLYEKMTPEQEENYYAVELRENMAAEIRKRFPKVKAITGDCQGRLDFADGFFDRYIGVHVLEHLPDLPSCIREAYRLLNKERGQMLIVIPCEGSPAYSLARKISAERVYNRHFKGGYGWFISREHINRPHEIMAELNPYFTIEKKTLFPLPFLPFIFNNLCIGLSLKPRPVPLKA